MSCREIFDGASKKQGSMDCPVELTSKCHPKHHLMVHVDGKKRKFYISCSKCERVVTTIRMKGNLNGIITRPDQGPGPKA